MVLAGSAAACSPTAGSTHESTSSASASAGEALSAAIARSFEIPELSNAGPFAVAGDAAWVRLLDGSVLHVDLASGEVGSAIPVGTGEFGSIAVGDDAVWVTTFDENTVTRIDPTSEEIVAVIEVGLNPEGLLVTPDAVWVANHRDGSLSRIDPATNEVVATVAVGPAGRSGPLDMSLVAGDIWTTVPNDNAIVRIDPDTNEVVSTIDVNFITWHIGAVDRIYAYSHTVRRVTILDAGTEAVIGTAQPPVPPGGFGAGGLWGTDAENLLRLDESTLEAIESFRISMTETEVGDMEFGGPSIWVLLPEQATLLEVRP